MEVDDESAISLRIQLLQLQLLILDGDADVGGDDGGDGGDAKRREDEDH